MLCEDVFTALNRLKCDNRFPIKILCVEFEGNFCSSLCGLRHEFDDRSYFFAIDLQGFNCLGAIGSRCDQHKPAFGRIGSTCRQPLIRDGIDKSYDFRRKFSILFDGLELICMALISEQGYCSQFGVREFDCLLFISQIFVLCKNDRLFEILVPIVVFLCSRCIQRFKNNNMLASQIGGVDGKRHFNTCNRIFRDKAISGGHGSIFIFDERIYRIPLFIDTFNHEGSFDKVRMPNQQIFAGNGVDNRDGTKGIADF